jgi:addiction module RelE/StbE family toxin
MAFRVIVEPKADLDLEQYSQRIRREIHRWVRVLERDPEPPESEPLYGKWQGHRRLHVLGTLRMVYRVDYRAGRVDVVGIGGRGSIY